MTGGHAVLRSRVCDLFGVRYPIVQTGMGWVSGVSLTAATSEAGGMGILASATMTLEELQTAVTRVKARTDKPFGVNLLPSQSDALERIDLIVREGIKVASFAAAPTPDMVARLKDGGVVTMPTVGAPRHAQKVQEMGVDAVIAQGGEGGGHTGPIATSLLVPAVADAVDLPIVAAGGFHDGRGLVAALAWGADGIAMGTRFLLTQESKVPDNVKDIYLGTKLQGTVVTEAIDGAPQRVVRTAVIDALEKASALTRFPKAAANALRFRKQTGVSISDYLKTGREMKNAQELTWSQLAMAANAPMLTKESMVNGRPEVGILPTGQVTGMIDELPTVEELLDRIMSEAEKTLDRLEA